MIVAVIEWNSDSGMEPAVFVADDAIGARRAAAEFVIEYLPTPAGDDEEGESVIEHAESNDGSINYIDGFWVRENPVPDLDDAEAVEAWLAAVREQTTDVWLSLYSGRDDDEPSQVEGSFTDVRVQS